MRKTNEQMTGQAMSQFDNAVYLLNGSPTHRRSEAIGQQSG